MTKRPLKEFDPFAPPATVSSYRPPLAHQALTWQQVIAILAGLAVSLCAIWAFAPGKDLDSVRGGARVAFAASLAACVAFTTWHIRSTRRRDLQPDILAQTVPVGSILEMGKCHVYFAGRTVGHAVEISGHVQNQTDAPGTLRVNFRHAHPRGAAAIPIPPLIVQIPAAAMVSIRGLFPCVGAPTPTQYKVFLDGRFTGGGKRVRFGRRRAFTRKVSSGTTASLVFVGVIFTGGGVSLTFTASGGPPDAAAQDQYGWRSAVAWIPDEGAGQAFQKSAM